MTARVGRGLAWSRHHAISPTRRNFPAVWPNLSLRDISVVLAICKLAVGGEQRVPTRGVPVPAKVSLVPLNLASPAQDRHCATTISVTDQHRRALEKRKVCEGATVLLAMAVLTGILSQTRIS